MAINESELSEADRKLCQQHGWLTDGHPDSDYGPDGRVAWRDATEPAKPKRAQAGRKVIAVNERGMNRTEARFGEYMQHWADRSFIFDLRFQAIKVRLAGRTWYTPDWSFERDCNTWLVDVKGHLEDDAAVKIKVAAETYPRWRWFLASYRKAWEIREVTRNGIGGLTSFHWV